MVETAAPPRTSAPVQPPIKEGEREPKFAFKFEPGPAFSLDYLLVHNEVQGTIRFTDKLSATYRTMSVEAIQAIEGATDLAKNRDRTAKFVMNEMTIAQLYHALVAVNSQSLPKGTSYGDEKDPRRSYIRSLPGTLFDYLVKGLSEFDAHCRELVGGNSLGNF